MSRFDKDQLILNILYVVGGLLFVGIIWLSWLAPCEDNIKLPIELVRGECLVEKGIIKP